MVLVDIMQSTEFNNITRRVSPGREKSRNLVRPFSRPGKSFKITHVMEMIVKLSSFYNYLQKLLR